MRLLRKECFSLFLIVLVGVPVLSFSQDHGPNAASRWVDSVFNSLSYEEKIGQLFMVAAYSNRDTAHMQEISRLIREAHIGGLIFFQGGPVRQAVQTNYYQSISKVPLLISIDAEWGLAMRLDSTIRYPRQMALGAIKDNNLIYEFGQEMARQCKRMGIHVNLAPVIDVNNNPRNPVINDRSFGEDKYNVTAKGIAYMGGMQDGGILANAKHFPGHGNTDKDSHKTLPLVTRTASEMDTLELYPFKELMKRGLSSVMVAHLYIPAYDTTANTASTLSKNVVTGLLKEKLQFEGLIFTDALNMKGVSSYYSPGHLDVKALIAGNDVLLFSEDVPTAILEIKKAVDSGAISLADIESSVRKILTAKFLVGLNRYQPVDLNNLYEDLNNEKARLLNQKLTEHSLTLLRNKNYMIPFTELERRSFAAVSIGAGLNNEFLNMLENYAPVAPFSIQKDASLADFDLLESQLNNYSTIIIGLHDLSRSGLRNYGITQQAQSFIHKISQDHQVVLVVFGNPYSLSNFDEIEPLLMAYEDNEHSRSMAAQLLFGGVQAQGTLPVSSSDVYEAGDGFITGPPIRVKYTFPEEAGINSKDLKKIDSIALQAIKAGATPGCQVWVAKDGKVIYNKSFGNHTWNDSLEVKNSDLYDLASVTKVASTLLGIMRLHEEGRIDLSKKVSLYAGITRKSNKKNLVMADILAHRAGLKPFIPFWKNSLNGSNYSRDSSAAYPIRVADNMYLKAGYSSILWNELLNSDLNQKGKYVYSDLGFYLMKEVVEEQYHMRLDEYVTKNFYNPLGLSTMGYLPRNRFPLTRLIPTEQDKEFRKQLVHGDVHDQGAAMLGGLAGHAGLFSNANDLGILMQMLMNKGQYGGKTFFTPATVSRFTAIAFPGNRRGLGFDKPEPDPFKSGPTSSSASLQTFGHTGFTGTSAWADPQSGLVYVFLSNRIHPSAENRKLIDMNVRTDIQQVLYNAIPKNYPATQTDTSLTKP